MSALDEFIYEDESITTSVSSMIFSIIILSASVLFSLILVFKLRKTMDAMSDFRDIIKNVYIIQLSLTLRFIISLIDFIIWYDSSGELSLNGIFESLIWLVPITLTAYMIYRKNLIIIPKGRETRRKGLIRIFSILLLTAVIILYIVNILGAPFIWEYVIYGFIAFELLILVYLIYQEFNFINSGINKIRLNILLLVYISFAGYIITIIILYSLIPILYPSGLLPTWYHNLIIILITASPIMISLGFYWLVHTPDFMRKRNN